MTDQEDHAERARQALWLARKSLDDTPAGGTIAPGLRGVYFPADKAHSAITMTRDYAAALEQAKLARARITGIAIDVERLECWLGAGPDAEGEPWRDFLRQLTEDLDTAVAELTAATADAEPDGPRP